MKYLTPPTPEKRVGRTFKSPTDLLHAYTSTPAAVLLVTMTAGAFYGKRNGSTTNFATLSFIAHPHGTVLFSYGLAVALRTETTLYVMDYGEMPTATTKSIYHDGDFSAFWRHRVLVQTVPVDDEDIRDGSTWWAATLAWSRAQARESVAAALRSRVSGRASQNMCAAEGWEHNAALTPGAKPHNYWEGLPLATRAKFILKWGAEVPVPRILLGEVEPE